MTCKTECTQFELAMELLIDNGFEGIAETVGLLTNTEVMKLPQAHQRRLRTVNMLERLNKEIKRRTRVATIFSNTASCLRLVSAVAMEISDEWETGRIYLAIENTTGSHES